MSELKTTPVLKSQKSELTLDEARAMLVAALAHNSQKYFKHLQEWFKLRTSKKVIDTVARRYLKHEGLMHYHEVFILTLLNEVGGLNKNSLAAAHQIVFPDGLVCPRMSKHYRPASPVQPLAGKKTLKPAPNAKADRNGKVDQNDQVKSLPTKAPPPTPAVNMAEVSCLPSQALMHGRFLLTTWEHGLQGVESNAAELLLEATKTLLKNVLTVITNDIKPFKRCTWSHMYHVEHNTQEKHKEIWYKEGESYSEEQVIEAYEREAMLNLLPKKGEPNYVPPEYYTNVPVVAMSTSNSPQPEEAETMLTASHVFHSLRRNPDIIPHDGISARTVMRASQNMKLAGQDKAISSSSSAYVSPLDIGLPQ